ncbi:nitric oxide dioxygenase [Paraburkholderia terricola]|uniref:nitric oxide dioxygenase n=1 Tax=Paraburkholderia terricola TaxID=169427 RepID=A0ABU1M1J8_9BURK|nr:NO-inducible flavohemoprotein [Paraburkholderia terricola]MDR6412802.1 nitric oxide dioxygenase [Paraburkholderia terricola]MDR6495953.1 nitric oxide dioxygenase [Paraburkholderia terricola]
MLTDTERDIIRATVPILETGGEALTTHFYKLLLSEYPQVRPLFNQAHQAQGTQQRALANGVLQYARHIDRLEALGPLAAQIVSKHVALQIQPDHYPIVGACLLRSIREVLGADVATDAVIDAWAAAYQQLADMLIAAEHEAYDSLAAAPGGWRGARKFRVTRKVPESTEITSLHLEPVDGQSVVDFLPGQYIGVRLMVNGEEIRRNYSLSAAANGRSYRISVKRECGGQASSFLHDDLPEGGTVDLFPPAGAFTLTDTGRPVALISAGVGITPTLPIAEAALVAGRAVTFIHYARNAQVHAFGELLDEWGQRYPQLQTYVVYEHTEASDKRAPDEVGRVTPAQLARWLPIGAEFDTYFVGPKPFMGLIKRALRELGQPAECTRYEFFGPAEALD